jgi:hypothetical protein
MRDEAAEVREAHAAVEKVRLLLHAPTAEALDRSISYLEQAVACVKALQAAPHPGPKERLAAAAGLAGLRQAVCRVTALLENFAAFHLGWSRQLAVAVSGYTPAGEPATPGLRGNLSVEG